MDVQQLYDDGRYGEVIALLKDKGSSALLAYSYQKSRQWESAMNAWNTLIVQSPTKAEYYNERGVCKFNLRFKHAIQDFDKAISLEPDNAYLYSCRAYIKDKTGDTEGSIADYTQSLALDPEDAITLNNLGLAEQKLGYTSSARERFKNSDDLLGIKSLDASRYTPSSADADLTEHGIGGSAPMKTSKPQKSTLWKEFKKMLTKEGFRVFLRELRGKRL